MDQSGFNNEELIRQISEAHDQWLDDFEANKNYLSIDFYELEHYFKEQQNCLACRAIYLHKMNAIIELIKEVLSLQAEKCKDDYH